MFWKFQEEILPQGYDLQNDDSQGDPCHLNILGVSNNKAEKIFKAHKQGSLFVCVNGTPELKDESEINDLISQGMIKFKSNKKD